MAGWNAEEEGEEGGEEEGGGDTCTCTVTSKLLSVRRLISVSLISGSGAGTEEGREGSEGGKKDDS